MFPIEKTEKILSYIETHFASEPAILKKYSQKAAQDRIFPHHISPDIGVLLQLYMRMIQARSVLEIGTLWGCSAWWISQALPKDGTLITLEKHEKHYRFAKNFFDTENIAGIDIRCCDALREMDHFLPNQFDMVFLDADKSEYPRFLEKITPLIRSGGILVADNVLYSSNWKGETTADDTENSRIHAAQEFNALLARSEHFQALPLPIRSGIMLAVKK